MTGRIHSYETMGAVDGPGLRFVLFLQGCGLRCRYCHNPDTWDCGGGKLVTAEAMAEEIAKYRRYFGRRGGMTVSGGEPLLQIDFLCELFDRLKSIGISTAIDTSGAEYDPADPRYADLLRLTDLVLLDIKHADPVEHKKLTGCDPARILAFGDELARRRIKVVIRHVVVPGITDTVEECEKLGRLIAPWHNVVGLEMLPYHTMGVVKYEQLGIPYKLEGVPQMDTARMPELRNAVMTGMKKRRAELRSAIG